MEEPAAALEKPLTVSHPRGPPMAASAPPVHPETGHRRFPMIPLPSLAAVGAPHPRPFRRGEGCSLRTPRGTSQLRGRAAPGHCPLDPSGRPSPHSPRPGCSAGVCHCPDGLSPQSPPPPRSLRPPSTLTPPPVSLLPALPEPSFLLAPRPLPGPAVSPAPHL